MARILLIDDDYDLRTSLKSLLEDNGHEVMEAANGNEGLAIQSDEPADLVITDLFMPEKEGLDTIMDLKRDNPQAKIIAISGGGRAASVDFLELARNLGASHTLKKPFEPEDFIDVVTKSLI